MPERVLGTSLFVVCTTKCVIAVDDKSLQEDVQSCGQSQYSIQRSMYNKKIAHMLVHLIETRDQLQ